MTFDEEIQELARERDKLEEQVCYEEGQLEALRSVVKAPRIPQIVIPGWLMILGLLALLLRRG